VSNFSNLFCVAFAVFLMYLQQYIICNMSNSPLMSRAEAARIMRVNRSTVGRYVKKYPDIEPSEGLVDFDKLVEKVSSRKLEEKRGYPLLRRRLLRIPAKNHASANEEKMNALDRIDAIRKMIDGLSDDEQSVLRHAIDGFFRPPQSVLFEMPVGEKRKVWRERKASYSSERLKLKGLAVEVSEHPSFGDYVTLGEAQAVERAITLELMTNDEIGLVRKLSRQLLYRDID
jgi:hypothetical protein